MKHSSSSLPLVVAHKVNSLWKIKRVINNPFINALEIDAILSPANGNIVLHHVMEEKLMRETMEYKGEETLEIPRRIFHELAQAVSYGVLKKYQPLSTVLDFINREARKKNKAIDIMIDLKSKDMGFKLARVIGSSRYSGAIYVTSKYHKNVIDVKKVLPYVKALVTFEEEPIRPTQYLRSIGVDGASIRTAFVDKELVEEFHQNNFIIAVWTVNDARMAKYLADLGVDIIITDTPEMIKKALR